MRKNPRNKAVIPISLILLLAAILLLLWLGSVPGLHGDEAWVGMRAHDIVHGDRPVLGMNGYTGSLHQYFVAVMFRLFGVTVWSLRLFGALASVVSVYLYYLCIRALANRKLALLSALLLVISPFFSGFGRIANEVFMLDPVLALGAILLTLRGGRASGWKKWLSHFACGVLIGLGIWTHVIFIAFAGALGIAALFRRRLSLFTSSPLYVTILGTVVGLLPRIVHQLRSGSSVRADLGFSSAPHAFHDYILSFADRLRVWPSTYLRIIHGDVLFQRFSGTVLFHAPDIMTILCVAGLVVLIARAFRNGMKSFELLVLIFGAALWLATALVSPGSSERYFLLPLFLSPLFIAELFQLLSRRWVIQACLSVLVVFQLARIGVNYFYSYRESGGRISTFYIGDQAENSSNYIGTESIYDKLVQLKASQVCSDFLVSTALDFYKLEKHGHFDNSWDEKNCTQASSHDGKGVYAVIYRSGARALSPEQLPGFSPIFEDAHFAILAKAAGNVPASR